MRIHNLKILNDFADAVVIGDKTFEIRENDRGYQKGDYIKFQAIDKTGLENQHVINGKLYLITFVMNGWGMKNGYVVLGIKERLEV
jgi:ParB family chromosome partitioning protein